MGERRIDQPVLRSRAWFFGQVHRAVEFAEVSRLELFLNLVFVYAFFATTNLMEEQFGFEGLIEGLLVALLLIRCWVGYLVALSVVSRPKTTLRTGG
ncbi:low temperature requirement protein A [Micromonospora tulbaghiae]|uniref:low temperature requirement protein A n=1 Tax=Micromonospora tulbaghiae TaxID=479978 RepID=UPI003EBEC2DF